MPMPKIQSTPKKKKAVMTTMIPTITEVIQVSFQLVQVTFRASARTSRRNCSGLTRGRTGASGAPPAVFAAASRLMVAKAMPAGASNR